MGTLIINKQISVRYLNADGKTKALYGFIEMQYFYIYYLVLPALAGLILGIVSLRKEQTKTASAIAVLVACITIALVFLRIWRFMV
jgi:hypothetical protein